MLIPGPKQRPQNLVSQNQFISNDSSILDLKSGFYTKNKNVFLLESRGSVDVKVLGYKPESRGFETRVPS
jgi:hypothetical protein